MLNVHFCGIGGQELPSVEISGRATVAELRGVVADLRGCASGSLVLLMDGVRLRVGVNTSLEQLGITDSSLLTVAEKPPPSSIVTASDDRTARIWDALSGEPKHILLGHRGCVNCAVYSPDGNSILTTGGDRIAKVWDASTGECTLTLSSWNNKTIMSAVYTPDGSSS